MNKQELAKLHKRIINTKDLKKKLLRDLKVNQREINKLKIQFPEGNYYRIADLRKERFSVWASYSNTTNHLKYLSSKMIRHYLKCD